VALALQRLARGRQVRFRHGRLVMQETLVISEIAAHDLSLPDSSDCSDGLVRRDSLGGDAAPCRMLNPQIEFTLLGLGNARSATTPAVAATNHPVWPKVKVGFELPTGSVVIEKHSLKVTVFHHGVRDEVLGEATERSGCRAGRVERLKLARPSGEAAGSVSFSFATLRGRENLECPQKLPNPSTRPSSGRAPH